jgi:hypothetical protein
MFATLAAASTTGHEAGWPMSDEGRRGDKLPASA